MKPLFLTQAWITQSYKGDVGLEEVLKGSEVAFFITHDTPIVITQHYPTGLRKMVGEACYVCTQTTEHGVRIVGTVEEIAEKIAKHLEENQ
jgi:demethoxyubiquinone hydroxylase (CLK1/Coq7/Cat5 family)